MERNTLLQDLIFYIYSKKNLFLTFFIALLLSISAMNLKSSFNSGISKSFSLEFAESTGCEAMFSSDECRNAIRSSIGKISLWYTSESLGNKVDYSEPRVLATLEEFRGLEVADLLWSDAVEARFDSSKMSFVLNEQLAYSELGQEAIFDLGEFLREVLDALVRLELSDQSLYSTSDQLLSPIIRLPDALLEYTSVSSERRVSASPLEIVVIVIFNFVLSGVLSLMLVLILKAFSHRVTSVTDVAEWLPEHVPCFQCAVGQDRYVMPLLLDLYAASFAQATSKIVVVGDLTRDFRLKDLLVEFISFMGRNFGKASLLQVVADNENIKAVVSEDGRIILEFDEDVSLLEIGRQLQDLIHSKYQDTYVVIMSPHCSQHRSVLYTSSLAALSDVTFIFAQSFHTKIPTLARLFKITAGRDNIQACVLVM